MWFYQTGFQVPPFLHERSNALGHLWSWTNMLCFVAVTHLKILIPNWAAFHFQWKSKQTITSTDTLPNVAVSPSLKLDTVLGFRGNYSHNWQPYHSLSTKTTYVLLFRLFSIVSLLRTVNCLKCRILITKSHCYVDRVHSLCVFTNIL